MRRTRLHRALPALLLAAALLTACGDETTSDGSDRSDRKPDEGTDSSTPLTPRTASFAVLDVARSELALLTQANLGPAFAPDSAPGEDETENPEAEAATGCEADVAFEDRLDPQGLDLAGADIDYLYFDEVRLMVVTSAVSSFGDESTAEAAFDALYDDIGECTHYEDASEDGSGTTVIDVTVDTDTATEDVDDQFDMVGGGTWALNEQNVPLGVGFSVVRIDSNVTMVMMLSIGVSEDSALLAPYTEIAADRLAAVTAGDTPEDVAAPLPTATPPVRLPVPSIPRTLAEFYAAAPGILAD